MTAANQPQSRTSESTTGLWNPTRPPRGQDHHGRRPQEMLRGQAEARRQGRPGSALRRDPPATRPAGGRPRPRPGPGPGAAQGAAVQAPEADVRAMRDRYHGGSPPGHRPQGARQTRTGPARVGRAHGEDAAQDAHRLRGMPRLDPREPRRARGVNRWKAQCRRKGHAEFGGRLPGKGPGRTTWDLAGQPTLHGAPRIARMIASTHVLIRLKSDIPLCRTSEILPDGSYRAELSGDNVTVTVRVVEYYAEVEGQVVPEMFCLVTDLMDYEEYPGPELAALYKWRWDGSETALREVKAPLRGAGPGTGPMLRSCSPGLVRQEPRGLGDRRRPDPRRAARRRPRRRAGQEGAPRRPGGPATRPVPCPRRPGRPVRGPPRPPLLSGSNQRDRRIPQRRRPQPAPRPQVQVPQHLRPRQPGGHGHPHRRGRHHHGQHPSLTSGNTVRPLQQGPRRAVDPAATARHAAIRHAHRKATTRSNQRQELPTTGQTAKAAGIEGPRVERCRIDCRGHTSARSGWQAARQLRGTTSNRQVAG